MPKKQTGLGLGSSTATLDFLDWEKGRSEHYRVKTKKKHFCAGAECVRPFSNVIRGFYFPSHSSHPPLLPPVLSAILSSILHSDIAARFSPKAPVGQHTRTVVTGAETRIDHMRLDTGHLV